MNVGRGPLGQIVYAVCLALLGDIGLQSSMGQTLGQALNATNLPWTTSALPLAWQVQNTITHDGVSAVQSGSPTVALQSSSLQTTTNGPGTLTFWWHNPSLGAYRLSMSVNGNTIASIAASGGFQQQTVYLGTGAQVLKWDFTRFSSEGGTPRGYVDEVSFTPGMTAPIIEVQPISQSQVPGMNALFSVTAVGTPPLSYQWRCYGTNIAGATSASYIVTNVQIGNLGNYSVEVTNPVGTNISSEAVLEFGEVTAWGDSFYGRTSVALGATNLLDIAAGFNYGLALRADGRVLAWGDNAYGQRDIPASLTNAVAISAGYNFALALRADGTVAAWGLNNSGQTDVPADLTNVVAVAAGANHSLALKADGTIVGWGFNQYGQASSPEGLSNVVAIGAGNMNFSMALKADGTIAVWGANSGGVTNVPSGLTNVIAVRAGNSSCFALRDNGAVAGWGSDVFNVTTPPATWTNIVKIVSGNTHNVGLRKDGQVVTWGSNTSGQTNVPSGLTNVVAVGAGVSFSLAQVGGTPPITAAPISNLNLSSDGLNLTIPTQSSFVYRLEYKESLADGDWRALPLVAGTGKNVILSDPSVALSQRFYRVRRW